MNISSLKTLAVSIPIALLPAKSAAQVGEKFVYKKIPVEVKGKIGAGYGLRPFFNQGASEAKFFGNVGINNKKVNAELNAEVGEKTKAIGVNVGGIIKNNNPSVNMEAGAFGRYQSGSGSKAPTVYLKNDFENDEGCILKQRSIYDLGLYFKPQYKINKNLEIGGKVESGISALPGMAKGSSKANVIEDQIVDAHNTNFNTTFGATAKYNMKNIEVFGEADYSTLHKKPGFLVGLAYKFNTFLK